MSRPESTSRLAEGLAFHPHSRVSRWQPGTLTSYSNSGSSIAAYVVEKITGKDFKDYVREHVFDPLGMESSTFHVPRDAALMAKGYEADGVREANYDHIIMRPSGSLNTSSREMARYLRMMINRGTLDGVRLLVPLLATLSIVVWFLLPGQFAPARDLGTISGWSLTWFTGSLVFVALTALSLHTSFRSYSVETGRFVRLHNRLVSLACTVVVLYCWSNGWIGLRMWAY